MWNLSACIDSLNPMDTSKETSMTWSKPRYQDFRFGFEITMYISAR